MAQSGVPTTSSGRTFTFIAGGKPIAVVVGHSSFEQTPPPSVRFPTATADHTGSTLYTAEIELSEIAQESIFVPLSFSGVLTRGVDWQLVADDGNPYTRDFVLFTAGTQALQLNYELLTAEAGDIITTIVTANSSATMDNATVGTPNSFTLTANPGAQVVAEFESANTSVQQSIETLDIAVVLSEPAIVPTAVTIGIITTDQLDSALSSTVVLFAVGEDRATAELTWTEDVAERDVLLRISGVVPGSIGAGTDHQVTITIPAVSTTAITVPNPGPSIDEGVTTDLVLTFAAASSSFNIAVVRSGTAPVDFYSITWPGLVDVFPITEGDTEFRLPITRNEDTEATGDKTLIFNLATATAGQYTLDNSSVTVTLQDDDANFPTVTFELQNYTTRQGDAQTLTAVASPAPTTDLTIAIVSDGNAPIGDTPTVFAGAVADEITILSGQTEATIVLTPTDTGQVDNTERTYAMVAAPGVYNPGQYTYASLVIEPSLSLTYDGDTDVRYDQMPGAANTLVRFVMGIDPVPEGEALPVLEMDGVKCAVHTHTRRWDRATDNVVVHALVPHRVGDPAIDATATLRPSVLADPAINQFYDLDVTALQLEIETNAGIIGCVPIGIEMESRESWWCSEKKYWNQFELTDLGVLSSTARPCGLITTIRRRSDIDMLEFEFRFCFDVYNLSDLEGHRDYRASTGGAVYARSIKVKASSIPANTIFGDSFEDLYQDGVSLVKAGPAANDWHRFDAGTSLIRSFYIAADTVTTTQAAAAQNLYGFGYPSNGHYSVHTRPTFGSGGRRVARYGAAYARGGFEGRAALRNNYAGVAANEINHALNGTIGNGFNSSPGHESGARGFWHPYGESSYENGGANEIAFTSGQYYLREEVVHKMILARYSLYRNAVGLTNYFTGEQITAADLAASNNGRLPWALYGEDNDYRRFCPHFYHNADFTEGGANTPRVHAFGAPGGDDTSTRGRAVTTHLWNQPGDISANIIEPPDACPYTRAEGPNGVAGIDHMIRDTMTYESPALHGELMYMDLVNRRAQWCMRSHTRFDVDPEGILSGFVYRSECIPAAVAVLNKAGARKFWGGDGYDSNTEDVSLQFVARGLGHLMHTVCLAGRFASAGTWADMYSWSKDFSHLSDLRLGPYGQGARTTGSSTTHPAGIQGYPDDPCQFGITDLINDIGALPTGWSVMEFHMHAYASRGFGDMEYTFRPRAATGPYESGDVTAYGRMVLGLLQILFTAGYGAGDKMPPGWIMVSTSADGEPDGAIGSGGDAVTNGRAYREWTFRRATAQERTDLSCPGDLNYGYQIYGGMTGQLGPWIAAAIGFARVNGITGVPFMDYIRTTEEAINEGISQVPIVFSNLTDVANSMLARIATDSDWISPVSQFRDTRWPYILGELQAEVPPAVAPVTPSLDFLAPGDSSVAVDWTPGIGSSPQDVYVVQWRTDAGTYNTIDQAVLGSTTVQYNVQGLTNDTLYWFRVAAREIQEGLLSYTDEASATPVAGAGNIDAPQNFAVVASATSALTSWDLTDVADTMIVLYSTTPDVASQGSPDEAWFGTNRTSGTVWNLTDGVTYYMVVIVRDGVGMNGPASEEWFVIPGAGGSSGPVAAPNPPSNPQAIPLSGGMLVTWDAPAP